MTSYRPASAVARIAQRLIGQYHTDLEDVRIEYVFRDEAAKKNGKLVLGTARKVTGLNAYLAQLDEDGWPTVDDGEEFFVIEIAEDAWLRLNGHQRTALVDHELAHCTTEVNKDDELVLKMVAHDLEEFRAVVERHGLWRPDLELFAESIEQGRTAERRDGDLAAATRLREDLADAGLSSVSITSPSGNSAVIDLIGDADEADPDEAA